MNTNAKGSHRLTTLLRPRSVVIVGGSEKSHTMSGAPLVNLERHGFKGKTYVVNPNRSQVGTYPSFPSIAALPEVPDTAVIVVSADRVVDAVRSCVEAGIGTATLVASGFGESAAGAAGEARTADLLSLIEQSQIRVLGPNTTGVINVLDSYVPRASINHPDKLYAGNVAIVGQSGALGNAIFNRALRAKLGVAYLVATGNQLNIDVWDLAEDILDDERVGCLLLVLETVGEATRIHEVAARAKLRGVPVVVLKIGTSELGAEMVNTHSGALAGFSKIESAVFEEEGILVVDELDDLWEVAQLVQHWGLSSVNRLALLSTSGGEAALGADHASRHGLSLPAPSAGMQRIIAEKFAFAAGGNPFDLTAEFLGNPGLVPLAVETMLAEDYDAAIFASLVIGGPYAEGLYGSLEGLIRQTPRPRLAISARTGPEGRPAALEALLDAGVPVFEGVERAMRAIGNYNRLARLAGKPLPRARSVTEPRPSAHHGDAPARTLTYWQSRTLLSNVGVRFNDARIIFSAQDAVACSREVGLPVTLKTSRSDATHKLQSGGLRLMLSSEADVLQAATELLASWPTGPRLEDGEGVVVEHHFGSVAEVFVGGHRDPTFGPVMVVGLGGSLAEQYQDVAYVRAPADLTSIEAALLSTKIGGLLQRSPSMLSALTTAVRDLSNWFAENRDVVSIDVNPVLLTTAAGPVAVDARVITTANPQEILQRASSGQIDT